MLGARNEIRLQKASTWLKDAAVNVDARDGTLQKWLETRLVSRIRVPVFQAKSF